MRRSHRGVASLVLLFGLTAPHLAAALQCPAVAPAGWGLPATAALSGVEVLSAPRGEKLDEKAPPTLVPDTDDIANHTLRQSWTMNQDGPGWSSFVDCHYRGTPRFLRLDASGVQRCDRVVTSFDPKTADNPASRETMVCR